jgi:peroxiredoxin
LEELENPADWAAVSQPQAHALETGDRAPRIAALDEAGERFFSNADRAAGRAYLLLFCSSGDPSPSATLAAFRDRAAEIAALDVNLHALSRLPLDANRATHAALKLPFKLLTDSNGEIFRVFGAEDAPVAIILDPNHRVARVLCGATPEHLADAALAYLRAAFPPCGARVQTQAPVLLLPRVLGEADCARLVELFHRPVTMWPSDGFKSEGHGKEAGDFKVDHSGDYGRLTEYVLRDPAVERFLDQRFKRRVMPEMRKAFQTAAGQREPYRIARYGSESGGVLNPHRDNATKETAHRRFTMTINLNAGEYEGGALRFREYGDQYYEVERGTAVVWSATLLHEVMPVTKGARFVLGVHMSGS